MVDDDGTGVQSLRVPNPPEGANPSVFAAQVAVILKVAEQPLLAREIASLLSRAGVGASRHHVNSALYGNPSWFQQVDGYGWQLIGPGHAIIAGVLAGFRPPAPDLPPMRPWQQEALEAWERAGEHGVVAAVTGAGKTRVGIEAARRHLSDGTGHVVIIVPTRDLATQWSTELALQLPEESIGSISGTSRDLLRDYRILVVLVQSMEQHLIPQARLVSPLLVIADECHRYGADTWGPALLRLRGTSTLGLSATPERDFDYGFEQFVVPSLGAVVYRHGHRAALDAGDITDFRIASVALPLQQDERVVYDALSKEVSEKQTALFRRYPILNGPARDFFPKLKSIRREQGDDADPLILGYEMVIQERTRHLFRIRARLDVVSWVANVVRPRGKMFLFCADIAESENVASRLANAGIPAAAHHSTLHPEDRAERLNQFRRGELRALVACRTLDEGIDVPDADLAVIVNGSSVRRQKIQRMGRVLRTAPNKIARIVILFGADTREDPDTRLKPDAYYSEMDALARHERFIWPDEAGELAEWVQDA